MLTSRRRKDGEGERERERDNYDFNSASREDEGRWSEKHLRNQTCRSSSAVRGDSYLWEMTVCKYLNLGEGTRGDTEKCHEIEGVSSQHLFHQAVSNELLFPDSTRLLVDASLHPTAHTHTHTHTTLMTKYDGEVINKLFDLIKNSTVNDARNIFTQ